MTPFRALEDLVLTLDPLLRFDATRSTALRKHEQVAASVAWWLLDGFWVAQDPGWADVFSAEMRAALGLTHVLRGTASGCRSGVVQLLYASAALRRRLAYVPRIDLTERLVVPEIFRAARRQTVIVSPSGLTAMAHGALFLLDEAAQDPALPDDLRERAVVIAVQLRLELLGL